MLNEVRQDRPADARFFLCPTTVLAGDAVLLGSLPAVALDSYDANRLGTVFRIAGSFTLTVLGFTSSGSPPAAGAVNPGDKIYARGTLDAVTNVTTGLTLDKTNTGVLFGVLDQTTAVGSGATSTSAVVKLNEGA